MSEFSCPSRIADGRTDRCGLYSYPPRCREGHCTLLNPPTSRPPHNHMTAIVYNERGKCPACDWLLDKWAAEPRPVVGHNTKFERPRDYSYPEPESDSYS